MRISIIIFLALAIAILPTSVHAGPDEPVKDGKAIFIARCAACHNVNKVLTGPALAGVDERHSIDWIVNFVNSSQTMVKKGDKEALSIYEKFNKIPMPDHPDLTADNIRSIVEYIKSESKPAGADKSTLTRPTVKRTNDISLFFKNNLWPLVGLMGTIVLLIGTLLFAFKVKSYKKRYKFSK